MVVFAHNLKIRLFNFLNNLISFPNKIFKSNIIKYFISYYFIFLLFIYLFGNIIYVNEYDLYKPIYHILIVIFGFNLICMLPYGFILYRFNYCRWSKLSYIFVFIITLIELTFSILQTVGINYDWDGVLTTIINIIMILVILIYIKWKD